MKLVDTVQAVAHHRNGITGEPFDCVLFIAADTGRPMVGVVFEAAKTCAVLDLVNLVAGRADDTKRGDNFEEELRAAIDAHNSAEAARWARELADGESHAAPGVGADRGRGRRGRDGRGGRRAHP